MPPKIFTSRYSNPELAGDKYTVVGVTRTPPKFPLRYQLQGNIAEIAPPGWLFSETNVERFIKCLHNFIPYTSFLYSVLIHT